MTPLSVHRGGAAGATIIVCGCGPSLHELTDPQRHITIGVNDIGRLFDPTYLVVVNPRSQFKGDRFRYVEHSKAQALFTQLDLGHVRPPVVAFKLGDYAGTGPAVGDTLHYTQNSPYVAVCLAACMGAQRIGLIGVDFTDDHFFAKTGRHPLAGRLKEIDAEYGRLAAALAQRGIELVNLSSTSRLSSLPKVSPSRFASTSSHQPAVADGPSGLRIVSYATTPVAGVPAILARCISSATAHTARCVWASNGYGNGVEFAGDVQWSRQPREAIELLEAADVVIVHNGKVDPAHRRLLNSKPVVTMAHNYGWNVDMQFVERGLPGVVVGQYQATLPEFAAWAVVPNPIPLWEPEHSPGDKGEPICIAFTPSGRHERYPSTHRLYWHGKGYDTTMRVLERLAQRGDVRIETTARGQVSHAQALAMKQRAHIVIDECVTGSYHRNSLEGLACGCVVVNGVGLLPGIEQVLRHCAPGTDRLPFAPSSLETLERVLLDMVTLGAAELAAQGCANRAWMEQHWGFAQQWSRCWWPAVEAARAFCSTPPRTVIPARPATVKPRREQLMTNSMLDKVSVVIPHGGAERLPLLAATLASLRQAAGVGEIIVVEMGAQPLAREAAARWADKHLFLEQDGSFERARALNAGSAIAEYEVVMWHDNDLLLSPGFIDQCARELRERRLDFLVPYTSVRYLSAADSQAVMRGVLRPQDTQPVNIQHSRGRQAGWYGCIGALRRDFLQRHGGLIEGFRGWGGEDDAWFSKAMRLGHCAATLQLDQHAWHLYHELSGGYAMGAAGAANPHYAANLALLARVRSVRSAAQFAELFPPTAPATGALTRSTPMAIAAPPTGLPIWTYWEGHCPQWIRACRQTIERHAPNLRLLTPQAFDGLRDQDRDIDLSHLHVAHRADYIRAFLLHRYGGLWIDADCLVMQSLQPVLDLLREHDFVGHRARAGVISNAFIAARPNSRIAAEYYGRVRETVRRKLRFSWNWLGGDLLTEVVARDPSGWHELPCARVQPICWSRPQDFLVERDAPGHAQSFDPEALCYMLSNVELSKRYPESTQPAKLLGERTFFSYLLHCALAGEDPLQTIGSEDIFAEQMRLFRQHGCESGSGTGSSLQQTQVIRQQLPKMLQSLGIDTLLDAPCGDLHWMRHVDLGTVHYIGVDLLGEVIADNTATHADRGRRFHRADVTRDPLPQADAILCRDLLPHLSFSQVLDTLQNFKRSGATYLLTTTFTGHRPNQDTSGGRWRTLNFSLPPFNFPEPTALINESCTEAGGTFNDKCLGLWRLADVPLRDMASAPPPPVRELRPIEAC